MNPSADLCVQTVTKFLRAAKAKDADGQRSCLTAAMRADTAFSPEAPFPLTSWEIGPVEVLEDCTVVRTVVHGVDADGSQREMATPFVLVSEEGSWCIDLGRTAGMQMTGDPRAGMASVESALEGVMKTMAEGLGQAMQGVADAMSNAFADARAEEYVRRKESFETEDLTSAREQLRERLGADVELVVETGSFDEDASSLSRLAAFVAGTLPVAIAMTRDEARTALVEGLERIVVRGAASATEHGLRKRENTLEVVLPRAGDDDRFSCPVVARLLELDVDPELSPRLAWALERAGLWQERWRESFALVIPLAIDWLGFTREWESLANAWSLHLLAEEGIDPLGEAIGAWLATDPARVGAFRDAVRAIRIEVAYAAEDRSVEVQGDELVYRLFVAEGHAGNWKADQLVGELTRVLAL